MDTSRSFTVEALLAESEWIHTLARSLVRDREAAEDVVQETWLAALRRRPAVRDSLRPWLARVLRNQAALRARRQRRAARERLEAVDLEGSLPSAADLVIRAETHRLLVGAVIELDEPYRSVVLLRYYQGLEPAEIARRRGMPGATVRTQLRRALERLRSRLDEEHGGERRAWMMALAPAAAVPGGVQGRPGGPDETAAPSQPAGAPSPAPLLAAPLPLAALAASVLLAIGGGVAWVAWRSSRAAPAPPSWSLAGAAGSGESAAVPTGAPLAASPEPVAERAPAPLSAAAAAGPLRGSVVDARTLEPLPHFQIELAGPGGARALARTDASGRFETGVERAAGPWEVLLVDDPRLWERDVLLHDEERVRSEAPRATVLPDASGEVAIPCPVGPTYRLRMDLPPGIDPSDLRAHLGLPERFHTQGWELHLAPVRREPGDRGPWVRFAELEPRFVAGRPPWLLEVSSRDGLWSGSTEVRSIEGVHEGVEILLSPRAVLAGTVRDGLGAVDAAVALRRADQTADALRIPTEGDGSYRFRWLEPGSYALGFESPRHVPLEREVHLAAGREAIEDAFLERRAGGGTIRGTLASHSGRYRGTVILALSALTEGESTTFAAATWSESDGRLEGSFEFEDVAGGDYELRIVSCSDQLEWLPPAAQVSPPANVRFECADRPERADLGFRVVDARDGSELSEVTIVYQTAGREVRLERAGAETSDAGAGAGGELWVLAAEGLAWTHVPGPFPIRAFPAGGSLRWMVSAPGFRPAFGDEGAFRPAVGGLRAEVALQPGWGLRLRAVDADASPARPLGGVRVSGGERALGRTAADGTLLLELDEPPESLSFDGGELVAAGGDLDPLAPPPAARQWVYEVRLRPR